MRKIEQWMIDAVRARRTECKDSTQVTAHESGIDVYLHGNLIASYRGPGAPTGGDPKKWEFTLAGWNTPTTRARINRLSETFLGYGIVRAKKGEPFYRPSASGPWLPVVGYKDRFGPSY